MSEPLEQHDAATRESLRQIAVALAHLWVTSAWLKVKCLPRMSTYFVYTGNLGLLGWGQELLKNRRIKVTIEIEEIP